MSFSHVHNCAQLVEDNDKLKRLITKVKRENETLKKKLAAIEEKHKVESLLRQYCTTRDNSSQTDVHGPRSYQPYVPGRVYSQPTVKPVASKAPSKAEDSEKVNKMLVMHTNLMKRYEKELKSNMEHVETITKLNLRVTSLEQQLKDTAQELHELKVTGRVKASQRAVTTGRRSRSATTSGGTGRRKPAAVTTPGRVWDDSRQDAADGLEGLLKELNTVRKERDRLARDKRKLKHEVSSLDPKFFEEIEDLKYALHRSTELNHEYEQALRRMCKQFGVPYLNPENKANHKT